MDNSDNIQPICRIHFYVVRNVILRDIDNSDSKYPNYIIVPL